MLNGCIRNKQERDYECHFVETYSNLILKMSELQGNRNISTVTFLLIKANNHV